jgi:hypothetical protein
VESFHPDHHTAISHNSGIVSDRTYVVGFVDIRAASPHQRAHSRDVALPDRSLELVRLRRPRKHDASPCLSNLESEGTTALKAVEKSKCESFTLLIFGFIN